MENTMDKISEFLSEKGIEFKASGSTVYSYYAPFKETARLKGGNVQITTPNGKIRICAEFPLRIRRKECVIIGREIAELNSVLPEFCGYTLDPISGSIQLIGEYDMPNDAETLGNMLDEIVKYIEEDIDMFFTMIHDAEKATAKADKAYNNEEDQLDEYLEHTSNKGESPSLLKKIINLLGIGESGEED